MRDSLVEPIPIKSANATLLFGKSAVECIVTDMVEGGFIVAVPNIEQYEGDPRLTLVTDSDCYSVRLALQEPMDGGYCFWLELTASITQSDDARTQRITRIGTYCCTAAMLAVAAIGLLTNFVPASDFLAMAGRIPGRLLANDRNSQSVSTGIIPEPHSESMEMATHEPGPTVHPSNRKVWASVSLISPASHSVPSTPPQHSDDLQRSNPPDKNAQHQSNTSEPPKKRNPPLHLLLNEGQSGLVQNVDQTVLPWLFNDSSLVRLQSLRMSQAALLDLRRFEASLNGLSKDDAMDAITHLGQLLQTAATQSTAGQKVRGHSDLLVIKSEDVCVYYRSARGRIELVRVLPAE